MGSKSEESLLESNCAIDCAKLSMTVKDYKAAKDWVEKAIKLNPSVKDGDRMLAVCEILSEGSDFYDFYAILRLSPSSKTRDVKLKCENLIQLVEPMKDDFPGTETALKILKEAKSVLCDAFKRFDFDRKRNATLKVSDPKPIKKKVSDPTAPFSPITKTGYFSDEFGGSAAVLGWRSWKEDLSLSQPKKSSWGESKNTTPGVSVPTNLFSPMANSRCFSDKFRISAPLTGWGSWEEDLLSQPKGNSGESKNTLVSPSKRPKLNGWGESDVSCTSDDLVTNITEGSNEVSNSDPSLLLSPKLRNLRNEIFDAIPQNPHYLPLEKYGNEVREGIKVGLDIAFINLYDKIRNLSNPCSFMSEVKSLEKQLIELKDMGYDVKKLTDCLASLREIVKCDQARQDKVANLEVEARVKVVEVENAESRISKLQAEIRKLETDLTIQKDQILCLRSEATKLKEGSSQTASEFIYVAQFMLK